jgi:hypothetical protein
MEEVKMSEKISATTVKTIADFKDTIKDLLTPCVSLEEAAQTFTNFLFEEFEESIILIRFFATIPFGKLRASTKTSVSNLADTEGITSLIDDDTPVLTLLGVRGGQEIRNSRQYFGIPLASTDFIASIPMISQLLKELGFDLNWDKKKKSVIQDKDIETSSIGFLSGVFYVLDAQHAMNANGEKLLSAVDRIAAYNIENISDVETIFGIGGAYVSGPFIAIIVFSKESLHKQTVEQFMPLANYFKTSTVKLALAEQFFFLKG